MLDAVLRFLELLVLGGLFGFCGGVFGIGGATIAIPAFGLFFGMTQQVAQGTAIVMATPNVLVGLTRYAKKAALDLPTTALLAAVAVPFTAAGAHLATSLASRPLRVGFSFFLLAIALDGARRALVPVNQARRIVLPWPAAALAGAVSGLCSGFFGIGGAFILVPALTLLFGYSQLAAQGMSLAFAAATAAITTVTYAQHGDVDWSVVVPLSLGGMAAVRYGVDLAHRLPERALRLLFVAFVGGVGIALLVRG